MTDLAPEPGLTITCAEVVELVTDYLEGVLDEGMTAEVEAHLALCEGCAAYLDQMRTTITLLGHVPVDALSPGTRDGLLAAFRDLRPPRRQ
jgi:predicted anti-sigma-YlaC factor YlaD